MYLALKEILYNKLRYLLVVAITFLITYMVFFMTSLALGLMKDNRSAIDNWQARSVVLSEYANKNLTASFIPKNQYENNLDENTIPMGYTPAVVNLENNDKKINASIFAQEWDTKIIPKLEEGRYPTSNNEIVADKSINNYGIQLGSKIFINGSKDEYTIVGITKNNKFLTSTTIYTNLETYWTIKGTINGSKAISAIVKVNDGEVAGDGLLQLNTDEVIKSIPGYLAQKSVFAGMIGALVLITSLVIGIFIYIITIQKLGLYGIMRAQGIKVKDIVSALFWQILILSSVGVGTALLAVLGTKYIIPKTLFFEVNWLAYSILSISIILVSLIGGLISLPKILKISPIKAIAE